MQVLVALVVPAVVLGVIAGLAASRWPRPVEAPAVRAPELVAAEARAGAWVTRLQRRVDPTRLTGLALTAALAVLALGTLGAGLLLRMVDTGTGFARYDLTFTRFGAEHASDWTTELMRQVSQLGGYKGVILIGILVAAYEVHRTRRAAVVAFLVVVIGGQYAVAETIKHVVDRTRPDLLNLTGFSGSSFPSGHATAAAATFMAVALLLGRGRRPSTRAVLAGAAAGLAGLVAATRVLLGVHWFTDVLAGMLVGWAWFALCSIAFGGTLLRFGAPAEEAEEAAEVAVEVRELAS